MSDLQTAFYIIGIIFMSLMMILIIAQLVAVFIIRSKVIAIHRQIEQKIDEVTNVAAIGGELMGRVGSKAARATVGKLKKLPKK